MCECGHTCEDVSPARLQSARDALAQGQPEKAIELAGLAWELCRDNDLRQYRFAYYEVAAAARNIIDQRT